MGSEFQQEQQRVDDVMEIIQGQINRLEEETSQRRDEVVQIRKHFWDEIKVNLDTFDDYLETVIGLRQEAQALSVSQSTHRHASERLLTLRRMQKAPYFGRIDFMEEGVSTEEHIYIGISTLTDDSGEDFLIYDWRAPISSVYYDYQPGIAQYATPGGIIKGRLEKKWQYLIRDGVLQSMFDTSLTIGDEILQQVLGKGTDKHMHNIVATIQQEQNRIIRHDQGKLLIVHGAAGSGKTSAALQRIAYLLYKYRDSLNADQIILFSPNSMFKSYVSNVLPELGEENMQQVTFQEYLNYRLGKAFQVENPYEQLEYVLTSANTPSYRSRVAGIRFKASTPFFETIESYRKSLETSGMLFRGITFRGKPVVTAQQIADRFYSSDISLRFHNRLEKDLAGTAGQPVLAAADGHVAFAGPVADRGIISLEHADGLRSTYEPVVPEVAAGEPVARGDRIGRLAPGHPGCPPTPAAAAHAPRPEAERACLHWGVRRGETYLDPMLLVQHVTIRLLPWDANEG